jgi:hypothetical protein
MIGAMSTRAARVAEGGGRAPQAYDLITRLKRSI